MECSRTLWESMECAIARRLEAQRGTMYGRLVKCGACSTASGSISSVGS